MMRPPPIRLGGRKWSYRYRTPEWMEGCAGYCEFPQARIDVRQDQSSVDEVDTILHETFHAILYSQGRDFGGKVEETYVRALATGLTALLQDNPRFASWLLSSSTK